MILGERDTRDRSDDDILVTDMSLPRLQAARLLELDVDARTGRKPRMDQHRNADQRGNQRNDPHDRQMASVHDMRFRITTRLRRHGPRLLRHDVCPSSHASRPSKLIAASIVNTTTAPKKTMPRRGSA